MKSTQVDADGNVTCPNCGAVNSFTVKRSGKAKGAMALVALPAIALAPKRLQCNGCGAMLKRGTAEEALRRVGPGARLAAAAEAVNAVKELRAAGVPDDEIKALMKGGASIEQVRSVIAEHACR